MAAASRSKLSTSSATPKPFLPFKISAPSSNLHSSPSQLQLRSFPQVSRRSFSCQAASSDDSRPSKVQELFVYEINERDRGSPASVKMSQKPSIPSAISFLSATRSDGSRFGSVTGDLQKRIAITA